MICGSPGSVSPDGSITASFIADLNDIVVEANDAFVRTWDYSSRPDVVGKSLSRFMGDAGESAAMLVALKETGVWVGNFTAKRRDGSTFDADGLATVVRDDRSKVTGHQFVAVVVDHRERAKQARLPDEVQVWRLRKEESLGRMAGAIAHHINNQLMAVMGSVELAQDLSPACGQLRAHLDDALQATSRAVAVGTSLLTYLGQASSSHMPLDLAAVCRQSLPLVSAGMPGNVVLETDLPTPGPAVCADASQIQQVLANLIANACEAIGAGAGVVRLSVRSVASADIPAVARFPAGWRPREHPYACIEVRDGGCGIAVENMDAIFDPFFSTRLAGRGLGLAIVRGIVRVHDGGIVVESAPGQGSTFRVFVPLVQQDTCPLPGVHAIRGAPTTSNATGVDRTVLVVDDEELVRRVTAKMLTRLGFTVLVACDGDEALNVFRERQREIHCVLCDLVMPRMDGWATLTELRAMRPDIPVIFASGCDATQAMAGDHPERPQAFLCKPYRMTTLLDVIGKVVGDRACGPVRRDS